MQNDELRDTGLRLEASRARFFELHDLAPVAYLTLDDENLIRDANLTAAETLGLPQADLIGRPLTELVLADIRTCSTATARRSSRRAGRSAATCAC